MSLNISCPISNNQVDENTTRIIAALVIILTSIGLNFNIYYIHIILAVDFALRAANYRKYSLLRFIAKKLTYILFLTEKPINLAPKRFSAGIGVLFSSTIFVFSISDNYLLANIIGSILLLCAFLETSIGFCVGCYIYSIFIKPFSNKI